MDLNDFLLPPPTITTEKWQIGRLIKNTIVENGIVILFVSDYRGSKGSAEVRNFNRIRTIFYELSAMDFELPICDLGDLISGKTLEDTHYALQEVLSTCLAKNAVPIVIGGSMDLSYSLFSTLNIFNKNLSYTSISNAISLSNQEEKITEENYLSRIFSTKNFSIHNFSMLGYQKHLNEMDSVKLIKEVGFEVMRLAEMMNSTAKAEPFFRKADLVTINCNAIESYNAPFSIQPQVNGLNRREICAYMKEAGFGEKLKAVGIFNFNFDSNNELNIQLLAQMLWYLIEGIQIQKSHPKEKNYETFLVIIGDNDYAFKRDVFRDLWYFGATDETEDLLPCTREDYDNAKKGFLSTRLLKSLYND